MRYRNLDIRIGGPIRIRYICGYVACLCITCSLPEDDATYPYAGWAQIDGVVECYNADYQAADAEVALCRWDCAHMGDGRGHKITAIWRAVEGCWTLDDLELGNCDGFFDSR